MFILNKKLFCIKTHRAQWWVAWRWDSTWPEPGSCCGVVGAEGGCCPCRLIASTWRDPNTHSLLSFSGMEGCVYSWEQQEHGPAPQG